MHSSCWALQPFQTKHQQFLLLYSSPVSCSAQPVWPHHVSFWLHIGMDQLLLSLTITSPLAGKKPPPLTQEAGSEMPVQLLPTRKFFKFTTPSLTNLDSLCLTANLAYGWVSQAGPRRHIHHFLSKLEHWATPESYCFMECMPQAEKPIPKTQAVKRHSTAAKCSH